MSSDTHQALRAALEKALGGDPKLEAALKAVDEVFPSDKPEPADKPRQKASDAFEEARKQFVDRRKAADAEPDPGDTATEDKQEPAA